MGSDWIIVGDGGHARSVADALVRAGHSVLALLGVEPVALENGPVSEGNVESYAKAVSAKITICLGENSLRRRLAYSIFDERVREHIAPPVVAVTASVSDRSHLSSLSQILEQAHIGPNVQIGVGTIVNSGAIVEHDVSIGEFSHIAPGAVVLGGARIGNNVLVGAGAVVLPGIAVGDNAVVGAGAVVRNTVFEGSTVAGVPAENLERESNR